MSSYVSLISSDYDRGNISKDSISMDHIVQLEEIGKEDYCVHKNMNKKFIIRIFSLQKKLYSFTKPLLSINLFSSHLNYLFLIHKSA